MHTLLVWEIVPEDTKLYLIPNEVADKYRTFLDAAQNKFANADEENEGLRFLANALSNDSIEEKPSTNPLIKGKTGWDDGDFNQYRGVLREYKVEDISTPIRDACITDVYVSGFVL
jgi:hypothetical protein